MKFLDDKNYEAIKDGLMQNDYEKAFTGAHQKPEKKAIKILRSHFARLYPSVVIASTADA